MAVPWKAVPALVPESHRSAPPFAGLARLQGSPIVSIEMWLDRVVVDRSMVGLRGSEIEWVFDKGRLYGREGPPQHLAFIASAAYRSIPRPNAELAAAAEGALRRYFPAAIFRASVFAAAGLWKGPMARRASSFFLASACASGGSDAIAASAARRGASAASFHAS